MRGWKGVVCDMRVVVGVVCVVAAVVVVTVANWCCCCLCKSLLWLGFAC